MYKGDFRCHGRFYGDQVQYLKSDKRAGLRLNGEPVVEIDVQSSIPFIFHAMHIGNVPDYDIYYHDSVPRDLFKLVYMLALNCKSRKQAQTGLQGIINKTPEWKSFRARELLRDLETRISNVSHLLYSELGIRLMNVEAECMTSLLSELNRLKIKRHPIHDSIICAKSVASQVEPIMSKAFTIKGYPPILRMKHYEQ